MADHITLDPRFDALAIGSAKLERLWTGGRWLEGPAYLPAGRYLVFSDIPNDECLRVTEEDMQVNRRFRSPAGYSNGNTFDREGRQIAFRHYHRDVLRYERDGKQTVLAARGPDGA